MRSKRGFTLIELLVTITIIVILMVVVIYKIKPIQLFYQAQDTQRISDVAAVNNSAGLYYDDMINTPNSLNMGSSSVVYLSVPDPTATSSAGDQCQGLGLTAPLPTGYSYHCAASSTFQKTNGTGWVPINFDSFSGGKFLTKLPTDPVNTTSSGFYYSYVTDGTNYETTAVLISTKYQAQQTGDNGRYANLYEKGTAVNLIPWDYSASQYIFVTDTGNSRVEKFDTSGNYVTQFGYLGTGNGQFRGPQGMSIDANGNIFVIDSYNARVEKFDSNGTYLSQFGGYGSGNGQFSNTVGVGSIAADASGNIYVSDPGNYRIEKFDTNGNYLSQFGSAGSGNGQLGSTFLAEGVAIDFSGNIYVVDAGNNRVEKFDSTGTYVSQFGSFGSGNGQFTSSTAIAVDSGGNIYVADTGNLRVEKFDSTGTYVSQFGANIPDGIAFDAKNNVYVTLYGSDGFAIFNASGTSIGQYGGHGSGSGQFKGAFGIAVY